MFLFSQAQRVLLSGARSGEAFAPGWLPFICSVISCFTIFLMTGSAPITVTAATPVSVPIKVTNASLPVTIGVPLPESAEVFNLNDLRISDPQGQIVPAEMRVQARWRGLAEETSKPVKWLLVDFRPATTGNYRLVRSTSPVALPTIAVLESSSALRVNSSRIFLDFPRQGSSLLRSFRLDGQEQLRTPVTVMAQLPRGGIIVKKDTGINDSLWLGDATLLKAGDVVRFELHSFTYWTVDAGTSSFQIDNPAALSGHRYLLDEGNPNQEEVVAAAAENGAITTVAPLRFTHQVNCTVRDLTVEEETATIKSAAAQQVQFTAPLTRTHSINERVLAVSSSGEVSTAAAVIDQTRIEESNALRTVIRQDGHFAVINGTSTLTALPTVSFILRYYIYADQPFVRVRFRLLNQGTYGFGASRTSIPPYAQHYLIRSLTAQIPTLNTGTGSDSVLTAAEAHTRIAAKHNTAQIKAGAFELSIPEFAENFPKAAIAGSAGLRFDVLPETDEDHLFEGGRAKTTDFYLGHATTAAMTLTSSIGATVDPAYIAATGAVRPAMVEKRNWASVFSQDAELATAASYAERLFSVGYAIEDCEGDSHVSPQTAFEYRLNGEFGENFGWQNFGDLTWGAGFANVHYDFPYLLLREYLRTGDPRAFQLGSEMARYRADWGQYHNTADYLDQYQSWNVGGMSFYEKGNHGSYREPVMSHHWIEGMFLYWALTGDETARESALEGAEAIQRFPFSFDLGLAQGESRLIGWPALNALTAWRYTGNSKYLTKSRDLVYLIVQAEEAHGKKGYFIPAGTTIGNATQPFMWSGYAQLGVIEFWRETNDPRVGECIVRVADWLLGNTGNHSVLKEGRRNSDGLYVPLGSAFLWSPDKPVADPQNWADQPTTVLSMMSLPVLTTAARITGREDLRLTARQLFRDVAFYRDTKGAIADSTKHKINFRSVQFAASAPKTYAQTGHVMSDYLADLTNSITLPQTLPVINAPLPPFSIQPGSGDIGGNGGSVNVPECLSELTFGGMVNVALKRPATASSTHIWPGIIGTPEAANDGQIGAAGDLVSMWHSESNTNQPDWWQVDLGQATQIGGVEIIFRDDVNQPETRRNFKVCASNDPTFAESVTLAMQGEEAFAFRASWQAKITDASRYRYLRVTKTKVEKDALGEQYLNFNEVRVFSDDPIVFSQASEQNALAVNALLTVADLRSHRVAIGSSLSFALQTVNKCGSPLRYSINGLPENAAFDNNTGIFTFNPSIEQAGHVYQLTFQSTDGRNQAVSKIDVIVANPDAPQITLLTPRLLDQLEMTKIAAVAWSVNATTPIRKYQIKLSTDGGATWPTVLAEFSGKVRKFNWRVPETISSSQVRLMIVATDINNRQGIDCTHYDLQVIAPYGTVFARNSEAVISPAQPIITAPRDTEIDGGRTSPVRRSASVQPRSISAATNEWTNGEADLESAQTARPPASNTSWQVSFSPWSSEKSSPSETQVGNSSGKKKNFREQTTPERRK